MTKKAKPKDKDRELLAAAMAFSILDLHAQFHKKHFTEKTVKRVAMKLEGAKNIANSFLSGDTP